jgi:hypothetical protein
MPTATKALVLSKSSLIAVVMSRTARESASWLWMLIMWCEAESTNAVARDQQSEQAWASSWTDPPSWTNSNDNAPESEQAWMSASTDPTSWTKSKNTVPGSKQEWASGWTDPISWSKANNGAVKDGQDSTSGREDIGGWTNYLDEAANEQPKMNAVDEWNQDEARAAPSTSLPLETTNIRRLFPMA